MKLAFSRFKKIPVYTAAGIYLGKVFDFQFSVEDNSIFQYEVRSHPLAGRLFLINVNQIVQVLNDRIIVVDAVLTDAAEKRSSVVAETV